MLVIASPTEDSIASSTVAPDCVYDKTHASGGTKPNLRRAISQSGNAAWAYYSLASDDRHCQSLARRLSACMISIGRLCNIASVYPIPSLHAIINAKMSRDQIHRLY